MIDICFIKFMLFIIYKTIFVGDRVGDLTVRMLDRKWPEEALSGSHVIVSRIFPYFFSRTIFPYFPPVLFQIILFLFSRIFSYFSRIFSQYFFSRIFSRTFSKVATFEIQRFKISVSCFSSTCRYITVHVPCGIAIQTSCAIWRDQKWIYLTQKRIEMFYSTNQSYHWKLNQSEIAISGRLANQKPGKKNWLVVQNVGWGVLYDVRVL